MWKIMSGFTKKINKWFQSLEIAKKLILVLLSISLIPILCIQLISYQISTSIIKQQTGKLIAANLEQSANSIQDFFKTYDQVILNISTDSSYAKNLKPINVWDNSEYFVAKHELIDRLQTITYANADILGIAIVGMYGDSVFYDAVTLSGTRSYCFDVNHMGTMSVVQEASHEKKTVYSEVIRQNQKDYGKKNYFYLAHQLTDFDDYRQETIGTIVICVDESALKRVYNQGHDDTNVTFIVDADGNIVSFPDNSLLGQNIYSNQKGVSQIAGAAKEFIGEVVYKNHKKLEVNTKSILDGNFYVIHVQDLEDTLSNVNYITMLSILIGLLVGIVCIIVALAFSSMTDRSVKKILKGMNRAYGGDYDVQISLEGQDEFEQISAHFNTMIQRIKKVSEQEREALVREKNAEIRSLEAQINPHFLYNTLDAINWVALDHEEFTVSKMLTSLAVILRYSVHKSNEIVAIGSELDYLKKYIYLQQQRFNYSFQCMLKVEEEVLSCRIHKLLIQPLIENTIVHGFPGNTGMDEIQIHIRCIKSDRIEIMVEDNGKGMEQELVHCFNHFNYQEEKIETSIGVRNVITRIKLYYGEQGSFHIQSNEQGTIVRIVIPCE